MISDFALFVPGLLLHFVRAGAFLLAMQLFGRQGDSKMARLIITMALAAIMWWVDDDKLLRELGGEAVIVQGQWLRLGVMCAVDASVGFAAGFAVNIISQAMAVAGEIISHDMGFAMSQMMDPVTGRSHTVMSQLLQVIVILTIFALDIHHDFLRVLVVLYEKVPVGQGYEIEPVFENLNSLISFALEFAMRYAFPIMGVLVLLTAVLVMLARAVQNINLMEFSFGLRILVAIFAAIYFLAEGMPFLIAFAGEVVERATNLFG